MHTFNVAHSYEKDVKPKNAEQLIEIKRELWSLSAYYDTKFS